MPTKKPATKSKTATPAKKAEPKKVAPAKPAAAPKKAAVKKAATAKPAAKPATKAAPQPAAKAAPAKKPAGGVFVRFERYSPNSHRVDLVGSFNGWELGKHKLARDEHGVWSIQVRLAPGTYEYKYVYDGQHYEPDPAQEQVANAFGSANNLLIVT